MKIGDEASFFDKMSFVSMALTTSFFHLSAVHQIGGGDNQTQQSYKVAVEIIGTFHDGGYKETEEIKSSIRIIAGTILRHLSFGDGGCTCA